MGIREPLLAKVIGEAILSMQIIPRIPQSSSGLRISIVSTPTIDASAIGTHDEDAGELGCGSDDCNWPNVPCSGALKTWGIV